MDNTTKQSVYVSLPDADLDLLNVMAANTGRTRSELVLEALRAHYDVMRRAYNRRLLLQRGQGAAADVGDEGKPNA